MELGITLGHISKRSPHIALAIWQICGRYVADTHKYVTDTGFIGPCVK